MRGTLAPYVTTSLIAPGAGASGATEQCDGEADARRAAIKPQDSASAESCLAK